MLASYYLWIKWAHLISVIGWAGSMVIMPWLYVILVKSRSNPDHELMMLEVIRFVLKRFMIATMIATYLTGLLLYTIVANSGVEEFGWLHAKFALVLLMTACHALLARAYRRLVQHGLAPASARFYRNLGFITAGSVVLVVYLVVLKPF